MKISILEPLGVGQEKMDAFIAELAQSGHDVRYFEKRETNPQILKERMADAEIAVLTNIPIGADVIEACPSLKLLDVAFTGFDHIDLSACDQKGIAVCNAAGFSTTAVAELSIAMALDLLRKITPLDLETRKNESRNGFLGANLQGKTFGIVGSGMIGLETARLAAAFGCKVLAYSRTQKEEAMKTGVEYCCLEDLCRQSDVLSLHLPLTEESKHLIGKKELKLMPKHAILINTARGAVVDYDALAGALKSGEIAAAAIDVYEYEPPLKPDHPLLAAPNTLLMPHIGYATKEAMDLRLDIVLENIQAFLSGKSMRIVNHPNS